MNLVMIAADYAIDAHKKIYLSIAELISKAGNKVTIVDSTALFLPAMGINIPASKAELTQVLGYSLERERQITCQRGADYINVIELIDSDKYASLAAMSSRLNAEEICLYKSELLPLGKLISMDIALSHKVHDIPTSSHETLKCCQSHITCLELGIDIFQKLFRSIGPDLVMSLEGYSIHTLGRLVANRFGIHHRFFTKSLFKGTFDSLVHIAESSLPLWQRKKLEAWTLHRNKNDSISEMQLKTSVEDIIYRFTGTSLSIYSSPVTLQNPSTHSSIRFDNPNLPLVSVFTSSLDEFVATQRLVNGLGESLPTNPQPFDTQLDWLSWVGSLAKNEPMVNFLIRIHPRSGSDHRTSVSSQYLEELNELLKTERFSLPNLRICWPENKLSSYNIMLWSQLIINGWSNICMEAGRLGIPVINTFFENSTSSIIPNSLFYTREDLKEYASLISRCMDIIRDGGIIQTNDLKLLRTHDFYCFRDIATCFPLENQSDIPWMSINDKKGIMEAILFPSELLLNTYYRNSISNERFLNSREAAEYILRYFTDSISQGSMEEGVEEIPAFARLLLMCK